MRRQSGVALITAVLIVALASIAAAAMLSSANLAVHRASTLSDTERAWWYADGIEQWVKSILSLDLQNSKIDFRAIVEYDSLQGGHGFVGSKRIGQSHGDCAI